MAGCRCSPLEGPGHLTDVSSYAAPALRRTVQAGGGIRDGFPRRLGTHTLMLIRSDGLRARGVLTNERYFRRIAIANCFGPRDRPSQVPTTSLSSTIRGQLIAPWLGLSRGPSCKLCGKRGHNSRTCPRGDSSHQEPLAG